MKDRPMLHFTPSWIRCLYVLAPALLLAVALATGAVRADLNRLERLSVR